MVSLDKISDFKISDCGDYFTIENVKANDFENYHTHINKNKKKKKNKDGTCRMLIKLICSKQVPKSKYLQTSAMRLSRDSKYIDKILIKREKDSQKPKFHKVNNGRF